MNIDDFKIEDNMDFQRFINLLAELIIEYGNEVLEEIEREECK